LWEWYLNIVLPEFILDGKPDVRLNIFYLEGMGGPEVEAEI